LTKKILFSLSLRNQSVLVTCCEDLCIQTVFPLVNLIPGTVIGVEDRVCIRPASFGVRREEMVGISKDVRGGNTVPLPEGILTRTYTGKTRRGFLVKRNRRNSFLTDLTSCK